MTLKAVFHLPLRQAEGFLASIVKLMDLDLPCPDHTTLSRRNCTVNVRRHLDRLPARPMCLIVDSTGLKVCGQGENVFFRYQTILGGRLRAKREEAQEWEAAISCAVLNRMLALGRPQSYSVR